LLAQSTKNLAYRTISSCEF